MLETLQLQLSNGHFDVGDLLLLFEKKLQLKRTTTYNNGSGISRNASYKNWNFNLSDHNLKAIGSLTKLKYCNNLINASPDDVKSALEELESVLDVPLRNATVKRLDVGFNLLMDHPVCEYLKLLLPPAKSKPLTYPGETTYFKLKSETIMFYDKIKEAIKKGSLGKEFKKHHLLRYEVKLLPGALKAIGLPDLKVGDLHGTEIYSKLAEEWYRCYESIPKLTKPVEPHLSFDGIKALKNSLAEYAIHHLGGIAYVDSMIVNNTKGDKKRADMRASLKSDFNAIQPLSPLLKKELDAKILTAYQHMLYPENSNSSIIYPLNNN